MKLDKLTDVQKKKIEADLITEVAGKLTLKKVAHSVAQSSTNDVDSVQQMFADVPASIEKPAEAPVAESNNEISFF